MSSKTHQKKSTQSNNQISPALIVLIILGGIAVVIFGSHVVIELIANILHIG